VLNPTSCKIVLSHPALLNVRVSCRREFRQHDAAHRSSNRLMGKWLIWVLGATLSVGAQAQSPAQLVDRMVQNELNAARNDHSYWMYTDSNTEKGKTTVDEVLQTPQGWMRRLISVDGRPPTPEQAKKSRQELQKFLSDPDYRKQQHEKVEQDGKKATDLLSILPKAFLYSLQGRSANEILLAFRPNPKFDPPTREAKVFHTMAGTLLIDAKTMRLRRLSGHLIDNVNFGFGILGKLKKGGTFEVDQADVGGGHWEVTKLDVHINGRALFFATIQEQQHEVMTGFQQVPPGTNLVRAAEMLKESANNANNGAK
jgi:hypothetical protein